MLGRDTVIFGYRELAKEIAREFLKKSYRFVIATDDLESFKQAKSDTLEAYFIEDIADDNELINLGVGDNIKYIFIVTEDDTTNIFLTLATRSLDKNLQIVAEAGSVDSKNKLKVAGANKIIDPYEIVADRIFDLLKKPQIIDVLEQTIFGDKNLNLAQIEVDRDSKLNFLTLSELNLKVNYNLIPIGVTDSLSSDKFKSQEIEYRLKEGDILIVVGRGEDIESFKSNF